MEKKTNKYIAVAYKLYTNENGTENMIEEAPAERPFQFISGMGLALDDFEKAVADLSRAQTSIFLYPRSRLMASTKQKECLTSIRKCSTLTASSMRNTSSLTPSSHCRTKMASASSARYWKSVLIRLRLTSTTHSQARNYIL